MAARVIVVAAGKGGVSKTTICSALAVQAAGLGERVLLIDAEPQQSLGLWWERRGEPENPHLETAESDRELARMVGRARSGNYDFVLVDTPPAIISRIEQAVSLSDFVLIPVRPSMMDVEAISPVTEFCEEYGRPFAFVVSHADTATPTGTKLVKETGKALDLYGDVLAQPLSYNLAHAAAMTPGKVGGEMPGKDGTAARKEIEALWTELKEHMGVSSKAKTKARAR